MRLGSSPLTRGAPISASLCSLALGIIPAYAGSTKKQQPKADTIRDHPRLRGEHSPARPLAFSQAGSSPLTRGAQGHVCLAWRIGRIIPAYAGSTSPGGPSARPSGDHPRLRGEHVSTGYAVEVPSGSSPLTRGARSVIVNLACQLGIIPAYAGSTLDTTLPFRSWWDHPRLRGEHNIPRTIHILSIGSSPLTRGAPFRYLLHW